MIIDRLMKYVDAENLRCGAWDVEECVRAYVEKQVRACETAGFEFGGRDWIVVPPGWKHENGLFFPRGIVFEMVPGGKPIFKFYFTLEEFDAHARKEES